MSERRDVLRESLRAIEQLQERLAVAEGATREPIAIIGAGCRFPGGVENLEDLWKLVRDGVDAIAEAPPERMALTPDAPEDGKPPLGGFLREVDRFDPQFFGISPREAETLDPQQRLLLETSWEALETAGIAPDRLGGTRTGVFVGITTRDYGELVRTSGPENTDVYFATGSALNAAAGRISYTLGLQGPCVALDTACSSSLVAVHLACQSLRIGECGLALASGVNLVLLSDLMALFSRWGMLAPDGRCKTFDAAADGFVRSEGCATIALKRLSDARRDGDPILAIIRGSAVNSDGRSSGLTVPNGPAQQHVLRAALNNAGLDPADIDYVEAHGTGTSLGDPIEVEALGVVMREGREPERPLLIGSIKTNIGHVEAPSGLAGLLKVVASLQNDAIPPHIHFSEPNPGIPWSDLPLRVPTRLVPWARGARPRRAGVSSFGFSGTNAHVVLEEPPNPEPAAGRDTGEHLDLVVLSARSETALHQLAERYEHAQASIPIEDLAATTQAGRATFAHRAAVRADGRASTAERLAAVARGQTPAGVSMGSAASGARNVAFLFPGQGSQWKGMGLTLARQEPVVQRALESCDAILRPELGQSLFDLLEREDLLSETRFTQPALFAVEWAMAQLWRSWGIHPAAVLGHSVGEYVAACVSGIMELSAALRLIAVRGRLMDESTAAGAMAAAFTDEPTALRFIKGLEDRLAIAAINAPDSVVISGEPGALNQCLALLTREGIGTRPLPVSRAFHSPLMDPMLAAFRTELASRPLHPATIPLISNVSGLLAGPEVTSPDYWVEHIRRPVRFARSIQCLAERGVDVLMEVGPGAALLGLAKRTLGERGATTIATLRRDANETASVVDALGALWVSGMPVDWPAFRKTRSGRRVAVPTYPFQRERHWVDIAGRRNAPPLPARGAHPLLGRSVLQAEESRVWAWEGHVSLAALPYLEDHRIQGRVIVPGTAYLEMVLAASKEVLDSGGLTMTGLKVHAPLALDTDQQAHTRTVLQADSQGGFAFTVSSRMVSQDSPAWRLHASGRLEPNAPPSEPVDIGQIQRRCTETVSGTEFYRQLAIRGNEWGPNFQGITRIWRRPDEALAEVEAPAGILNDLSRYRYHPALSDTAGHALAATIPLEASSGPLGGAFVGGALDSFVFRAPPRGRIWAHVVRRPDGGSPNVLSGDIRVIDETGAVVAETRGTRLWYLEEGRSAQPESPARRLYQVAWRPSSIPDVPAATGNWLVFSDPQGVAVQVANQLASGGRVVTVVPGAGFERKGPDGFAIRTDAPEDFRRLLTEVGGESWAGILHAWSMATIDRADREPDLAKRESAGPRSAFALIGALSAESRQSRLPIWFLTRGAQPVSTAVTDPVGAALWGLGRTLGVEAPHYWGGLVDLDPAGSDDPAELARILRAADGEDQIALRDGARLVARLTRAPQPAEVPLAWRADASYLITGGLGGIGLQIARWMVREGARRLVLMGRTALPPRTEWDRAQPGSLAARRIAAIRELESLGASVHLASVDVGDRDQLNAWLDQFEREGWPPIRGVMHAAGTMHRAPLSDMTPEAWAGLWRPKALGAWHLHQRFADRLDFFVLFSSASALLSSALIGGYAASNAFLDGLAQLRRSRGMPAQSIEWGLWAGAGMADKVDSDELSAAVSRGMGALLPEQALEALDTIMRSRETQIAVIPVDWEAWRERYPMFVAAPYLSELFDRAEPTAEGPRESGFSRDDLLRMDREARPAAIRDRIRTHAAAVLRLGSDQIDDRQPLASFGIDSLMALELKNRVDRELGLSVPLVHYLDGSGIVQLTEVVMRVGDWDASSAGALDTDALLAQLPQMSEEEMDALLAQLKESGE